MKRIVLRGAACCLAVLMLLGLCSCKRTEKDGTDSLPPYELDRLSETVLLDAYEGLTVALNGDGVGKSEAIWDHLISRAELTAYPEAQVGYYENQIRSKYEYTAKQEDLSYEALLKKLGVTEEDILAEAKRMVKGDLVYRYIVADAEIEVTETEKETLFDRYVEKFMADYGYERAYVTEEMRELIYDAMLYDKTTEYLILHNTFVMPEA
ncbi:MAG: hypothetical protein IKA44_03500 [Clostridia bacterium]|nr:hypothetical protein [Clostridia bacterium]